jgi:hypothetical protein
MFHRPPRCGQRDPVACKSDLSCNSSSDSGFSSRSPTPNKQQSTLSDMSSEQLTGEEEIGHTQASTSVSDMKGVK